MVQEKDASSKPEPCLASSQNSQLELQETNVDLTVIYYGDDIIRTLTAKTPHLPLFPLRDRSRKELYMPLSSTIMTKRKKRDAAGPSGFQKLPKIRCFT